MQSQQLGISDLSVSRIAYGCMPLGGSWDFSLLNQDTRDDAVRILRGVIDQGINFFDHADIYCRGKSEEAFASIWSEIPHIRQKIFIQSKCGIRFSGDPNPNSPHKFDFSYDHIVRSVENSLRRLETDYLDVLLLHRPDPLVEPEEVAHAFDKLATSGKVRWFGVSNHTAAQIDLLRAYVRQPIIINQIAFNLIHTHLLNEGIVFNQDNPLLSRDEGTLEYCRLHHITLQAWGSLAWGYLTGRTVDKPNAKITETAKIVYSMAQEKEIPPEAILIAWILRHPAQIQPVIGTTNADRILAACQGDNINLTRDEWYTLFTTGRGEGLP